MPLYAIVLPVHIALAIALFLPALLLPFALRTDRPATESPSRLVRALLRLQSGGSVVTGIGLAITGVLLVASLGMTLLAQPWLLVALTIYALNLAIAFFIQRPRLRALVGLRTAWDDLTWKAAARRQRYLSYGMAGLIGIIGYLMSAKPQF
ncbi:MAG: DUF2269 family protein [Candidatus Limnocylindrales bacterium]